MKKEYERYSHAKVHIRYHMILSTKYRRFNYITNSTYVKTVKYK